MPEKTTVTALQVLDVIKQVRELLDVVFTQLIPQPSAPHADGSQDSDVAVSVGDLSIVFSRRGDGDNASEFVRILALNRHVQPSAAIEPQGRIFPLRPGLFGENADQGELIEFFHELYTAGWRPNQDDW